MEHKKLEINVALQIQKPIEIVFEAIINPEKMANYFISKSSGIMEENKELFWNFPEFEDDYPIQVGKIIKNEYISFYWEIEEDKLLVEIKLELLHDGSTLVSVSEKSMNLDEKGLKWLSGNSFGWSNFLACLKAYLEYNINLRKGAFEFMKIEKKCS
ncbi:SRPBCC domain-containing protein [Flavobacterium sp.]|uniref:SRPBCC domain-containing protein n=1 Tax=Flavobacterium sp. TaxID=239 RepID=UPI0035292C7F